MKEVWKPVVGFEGLYKVSNLGRVKSLCKTRRNGTGWIVRKERLLKPCLIGRVGKSRHLMVNLRRNGVAHGKYVHRLVLEAFVGPCPIGKEARHYPDRNTSNNRISNLQWGTKPEQYQDRIKHGTDAKSLWAVGRNGNQYRQTKLTHQERLVTGKVIEL